MDELIPIIDDDMLEFLAPEERPNTDHCKSYAKYQRECLVEDTIATGNISAAGKAQTGNRMAIYKATAQERLQLRRAQHVEKLRINAENVLREYARIAFFDVKNLFDDEGNPLPLTELDDNTSAAIAGVDVQKLGKDEGFAQIVKYKLADKLRALDALAKRLNLFDETQKHVIEGNINIGKMSKTEKARRVAFLLAEAIKERQKQENSA